MRKIAITLIGAYGTNTGDNAILLGTLYQLNTIFSMTPSEVIVYVLTNYPDYLVEFFGSKISGLDLKIVFLKITKLGELLRALLFSNVIIWGGGGLIVDDWHPIYSTAYLIPIVIAWVLRKKIIVYSIGASIPKSRLGRLLIRIVLSLADKITVRDINSMKALRSIGINKEIELCLDPAIELETNSLITLKDIARQRKITGSRHKNHVIVLSLRYIFKYSKYIPDHKYLIKELVTFINTVIEKYNATVIFVPFNKHPTKWFENDLLIASIVKKGVKHKDRFIVLDNVSKIQDIITIIKQADILIGARLHSLILGVICGVPIIGIISDKKNYSFMKMFGLENFLVYPNEPMMHNKLLQLYKNIINNKNSIVEQILLKRELLRLMNRKCLYGLQHILLQL